MNRFYLIVKFFSIFLLFYCYLGAGQTVFAQTGPTPGVGGILQFKSGFESSTYLTTASGLGRIFGTDNSVASGMNNWNNIPQYLPWAKFQSLYSEGGSWSIGDDPVNSSNKVLHFHNISQVGGISRSQWSLKTVNQWTDDGTPNLFDKQFYRVRMYIPEETGKTYALNETSPFYMIWESHAWEPVSFSGGENTRYGIYIDKFAGENFWHFRVVKQRPEGMGSCTICWLNCSVDPQWCDVNHKVPFAKWFTLEVFFKYAATDGEFYVAYQEDGKPRQIVGHFKGQTKYDQKLHDQALFKLYHDQDFLSRLPAGTDQYYDNLEIWSDYPPGYWSDSGGIPTPIPTNTPTSIPTTVLGDANSDGKVDGVDYVIWLNHYNTSASNGSVSGDFNNDNQVDGIDYVVWLNNYGR